MDKIEKCPFCKSTEHLPSMDSCSGGWFVACNQRKCEVEGPVRSTAEEAIKAWNKGTDAPNN
jgi:hypothetical protein